MFDANGGSILTVSDVSVHFGGLLALDRVTFNVARGSRHGILGPNGAGKTTLFNVITGFVSTQAGIVRLNRNDISALSPHRRARLGLVRTFQITTLFKDLTVLENALLGALVRLGHHRNALRAARDDSELRLGSGFGDPYPVSRSRCPRDSFRSTDPEDGAARPSIGTDRVARGLFAISPATNPQSHRTRFRVSSRRFRDSLAEPHPSARVRAPPSHSQRVEP